MHMHLVQVRLSSPCVPAGAPTQLDAWRAFLNAHAHVTRAIGRDLAAAGLPDLGWYDLLWTLYRAPERRLRVNELAREVVLSPTAMSRFVDRAEKAGVVRREPDPADRRALQVALTDEGVELLRRMWPVYEQGIERHFAAQLDRSPPRLRRDARADGGVGARQARPRPAARRRAARARTRTTPDATPMRLNPRRRSSARAGAFSDSVEPVSATTRRAARVRRAAPR